MTEDEIYSAAQRYMKTEEWEHIIIHNGTSFKSPSISKLIREGVFHRVYKKGFITRYYLTPRGHLICEAIISLMNTENLLNGA